MLPAGQLVGHLYYAQVQSYTANGAWVSMGEVLSPAKGWQGPSPRRIFAWRIHQSEFQAIQSSYLSLQA